MYKTKIKFLTEINMEILTILYFVLAIWLCVCGTAKCKWVKGSSNQKRTQYIDHEYYFQSNTTLLSSGSVSVIYANIIIQ